MNMSAATWQAVFEGIGVLMVLWNLLNGMLIYRMGATFVTRAELKSLTQGVADNGKAISKVTEDMGHLVNSGQVSGIYDRLGVVERQGASVAAQVTGIERQMHAANNMLQMLVKNEIDGAKRP